VQNHEAGQLGGGEVEHFPRIEIIQQRIGIGAVAGEKIERYSPLRMQIHFPDQREAHCLPGVAVESGEKIERATEHDEVVALVKTEPVALMGAERRIAVLDELCAIGVCLGGDDGKLIHLSASLPRSETAAGGGLRHKYWPDTPRRSRTSASSGSRTAIAPP